MKPSRVEKIVFLYSRSSGSRERRVIDTLNGYCRFSGRRLERGRAKARLKNSITRYESVTGIEPKLRGAHTPAETDRRNERRYRVYTTGPLAGCTNIFSSGCYEWLAIIDAVVGLPTTPGGKSSDSRGNGHVETRACYRSYARRSQPRLFIIGRATVTRSAILDSTDVALTLLNNLDMFTIL